MPPRSDWALVRSKRVGRIWTNALYCVNRAATVCCVNVDCRRSDRPGSWVRPAGGESVGAVKSWQSGAGVGSGSVRKASRGLRRSRRQCALGMTAVLLFAGSAVIPPVAQSQPAPSGSAANHTSSLGQADELSNIVNPGDDRSFYELDQAVDLAAAQPGDVLRQREISLHLAGLATPVRVTQLQYRTTDTQGRPEFNVTSVLHPTVPPTVGSSRTSRRTTRSTQRTDPRARWPETSRWEAVSPRPRRR